MKKIKLLNGEFLEVDTNVNAVFSPVKGKENLYIMTKPQAEVPVFLISPKSEKINARRDLEIFLTSLLKQTPLTGRQKGPSYLKMETFRDKVVFLPGRDYAVYGFCGKLWLDPSFVVLVSAPSCANIYYKDGKVIVNRKGCYSGEKDKKVYVWLLGKPKKIPYTVSQLIRVAD